MSSSSQRESSPRRPGRFKRKLKWTALVIVLLMAITAYAIQDDVRTLRSLRRVGGTNAYVMDYYCDYGMDHIRSEGMDVDNVEDSFIGTFFPAPIAYIARQVKAAYLSDVIQPLAVDSHHCSTVAFRNSRGETLLGRNFDWKHNACLILKIHRAGAVSSVAVIDLAYLNLDRTDLDETSLVDRIPLLFSPYYVMDGMNRHGVAVSDMSLRETEASYDPARPDVLSSTAMRLVLDYAKTTEEAVDLLTKYNIRFVDVSCHYMIADAHGDSAVVEFIDGQLQITYSNKNWQVCTNSRIWGTSEEECDLRCNRYRVASEQLDSLGGETDVDGIMEVMDSVAVEGWTMWTSVYNLSTGEFLFSHRKPLDNTYRGRLVSSK